ncbi:MAG: signal recognition particle-docking protein FtsY [Clostridiales Family XIII bacterium]|jgi:fused signal recognition particle receptor|nr:signal recognition particle-docking protein FtsY [Clostridiales Family XIII bacterium]
MAFGVKKSFFGKLQERIGDAILLRPRIDDALMDELEEILITSDIGMATSMRIIEQLREDVRQQRLAEPSEVESRIAQIVESLVDKGERLKMREDYPLIILMIGVNGGGKTTTIAKLAAVYKDMGKSVILAAADTFRAAAADQLEVWAGRVGVDIIRHGEGADPSAVVYDSIQAAKARGIDVLICDTAGRLHNKKNLMNELEKMNKIIDREYAEAARETLLVLDATTGKNAVSQAKEFGSAAEVTGIVITKLDGTAKGGIAITIADEFDLPIKFIGVGERIRDLAAFDPRAFAESIFAGADDGALLASGAEDDDATPPVVGAHDSDGVPSIVGENDSGEQSPEADTDETDDGAAVSVAEEPAEKPAAGKEKKRWFFRS